MNKNEIHAALGQLAINIMAGVWEDYEIAAAVEEIQDEIFIDADLQTVSVDLLFHTYESESEFERQALIENVRQAVDKITGEGMLTDGLDDVYFEYFEVS